MHGINEVTFASKKYITLNIIELESQDFPRILRQNYNTWRTFQAWNAIMSNLMTFAWYQDNWKLFYESRC